MAKFLGVSLPQYIPCKTLEGSSSVRVAAKSHYTTLFSFFSIANAHEEVLNGWKQVENHVVGAPCGVMDQMASACGEANKLLAMVCQVCPTSTRINDVIVVVDDFNLHMYIRLAATFMRSVLLKARLTFIVSCCGCSQQK